MYIYVDLNFFSLVYIHVDLFHVLFRIFISISSRFLLVYVHLGLIPFSSCVYSSRSHSLLFLAGTPGAKAKICVTILDPQIHFSFEMFQGLVSLETQARLEQLHVSKSAAAATAAMKAAVAAAAAAAEANAVALTQQQPIREQDLQPSPFSSISWGAQQQPYTPQETTLPSAEKTQRSLHITDSERSTGLSECSPGVSLVGGGPSSPVAGAEGGAGSAAAAAALGEHPSTLRVTNYSVSLGDLSVEGSLLRFLRDYAFSLRDAAGPPSQQRQRPLFSWAMPDAGGGKGSRGGDPAAQAPIVGAMDLVRLHQQRRGGALGRALEELKAISSGPQSQPPDEAASSVISSRSSSISRSGSGSSSIDSPVAPTTESLSWGPPPDGMSRQQLQNEMQSNLQPRKGQQQQQPQQQQQQQQGIGYRDSRNTFQRLDDEEVVDSAELLLLANLMAAGSRDAAAKPPVYGRGLHGTEDELLHEEEGPPGGGLVRRRGMGIMEGATSGGPGDVGACMPVALLQGVGEADFRDPYCQVIGFFLSLMSFKLPGETEFEVKGEVVRGAFEFHDAHGSLLKVSLLALEGQVYVHPELFSADSIKSFGGRLELMVSGYDPMTNSQEELLHPVSASVEIQRQYVDAQTSHWSLVNVRSAMDGVSVDITSGLLQLVYHIMGTTREILDGVEGNLGRHTSLRVYNDIHAEVLVMHKRRSRGDGRGFVTSILPILLLVLSVHPSCSSSQ